MDRSRWRYDEMKQTGMDFEDVDQVSRYDAKQGSDPQEERLLLERLRVDSGQVVVDLGCGSGSFAREAARTGAEVRAVDISGVMLESLRDLAQRENLSNLRCEHAGFLTFDAPPDSIDVVVTRFALHHLPDFWKQVALLRLQEAIRPGGLLYLRDVVFSFDPTSYEAAIDHWVNRMPSLSSFVREEFEMHVREEYSTFAWVLEGFLERAGFDILERVYPAPEYAEYVCTPGPALDTGRE
jgi:putative AdoMet-dependent methyltransferase